MKKDIGSTPACLRCSWFLLVDEPAGGLDQLKMQKMVECPEQFRQEDRTVLVITHDYELIRKCPVTVLEFIR